MLKKPLLLVSRTASVLALLSILAAGCARSSRPAASTRAARPAAPVAAAATGASSPAPATHSRTASTAVVVAPGATGDVVEGQGGLSIAALLESLGDEGKAFHAHLTTLSNPFYEGRAPGTRGNELAAEYIEHYFEFFGLKPAFALVETAPGGAEVMTPNASWRQAFNVPGDPKINKAIVSYDVAASDRTFELKLEDDFNPLGFGANGDVQAALAFAGYAIEEGKDGYSSFGPHDDLTDKVVMVMRFEPMDDKGRSLWSEDDGWSQRAGLLPKARAAALRGAKGVILVNAPGADDRRANRIMSIENSRVGGRVDVPVVMMTTDAAEALVKKADAEGRSLLDLRRLADKGEITSIELPGVSVKMEIDAERTQIPTQNVGGVLAGRGALTDEWVVLGAHYDHIGYGKFGTRSPEHRGEVHPGADDNASGTAGLLVLAQRLSAAYAEAPADEPLRSVLFLAFSAEEMGLLGSKEYVAHPSVPLAQVCAMINMDMIGRLRKEGLEVSGVGTGEGMKDLVAPLVASSGLKADMRESGSMPSDQASFLEADVPVLGFFTGTHPEYHTVHDVGSTVNHAGAVAIVDLIAEVTLQLAKRPDKLAFHKIESRGRQMGSVARAKVRLGIAPGNYADNEPGVLVGGVSEGTTAAKGGVLKGDRIIRWGGEELPGVEAMMERLGAHNPGDKVQIVVLRDGKEVTLDLVMQGRSEAQ